MRAGEDAAREVGVIGIPKEILQLLGELKYRTSYGQNVLKHSTEMAHMAGYDCRRSSELTLKQLSTPLGA